MKLVTFRILNYRSINDSGDITVGKLTSLVGRNEAGKSNLLLALQTLNPAEGVKDLSPIKNFPRQRRLTECTDETPVVSTMWELDAKEQGELVAMFPRSAGVSRGLKWFISFYMTFSADTKGGSSQNAILLLDEPGMSAGVKIGHRAPRERGFAAE